MRVQLAYDSTTVELQVPDEALAAVIEPAWPAPLERPQAAVAEALRQPVAGPPLGRVLRTAVESRGTGAALRGRRTGQRRFQVVILVSDLTRPCPNQDVLVPILAEVRQAGIPPESVTILIGTGLHAPLMGERTAELLGPAIAGACRVVNHFGHRGVTLAHLGRTAAGTPVVLSRPWVQADVRIATGVVEPHLMAGFSGGRKAVCPGVAGAETVLALHSPKFLEHPRALPGCLEGNPEHEEALAAADFAPPHFTINVTVDRTPRLTGVFAGDMRAAHQAGVAHLRWHAERQVPEPCDVLVTTSGGRPLDATLYGAEKGLLTALRVLKRGGSFVWAAALADGLGGPEFTGLVRKYGTIEEFHAAITAPGAAVVKDQWALENLAKAVRHADIFFWSDRMPWKAQEADLARFVTPVRSLEEGLARALAKHGPQPRVIVLPHGPYVLPYV